MVFHGVKLLGLGNPRVDADSPPNPQRQRRHRGSHDVERELLTDPPKLHANDQADRVDHQEEDSEDKSRGDLPVKGISPADPPPSFDRAEDDAGTLPSSPLPDTDLDREAEVETQDDQEAHGTQEQGHPDLQDEERKRAQDQCNQEGGGERLRMRTLEPGSHRHYESVPALRGSPPIPSRSAYWACRIALRVRGSPRSRIIVSSWIRTKSISPIQRPWILSVTRSPSL